MNRLVYVSPLRGYPIRVVVAQNKQINAGTNGRLIFMNSGLLDVIWHDKDLVAAVLAHELGHIIAHHTSYQNNREGAASAIRTASPMMSWTWLGSLIAMGLRESLTMTNRSFGRYDEKEADMIAAYLTHKAGFDPDALNRFFGAGLEKNKVLSGNVTIPITNYANPQAALQSAGLFVLRASPLYKTHPPSKSRTKALTKMSALLKGEKTAREIKQSDRWIWRIHQTLKKRTPKTKKSVSS